MSCCNRILGRRVIAVDIVDYRLRVAAQLGADVSIKSDDTLIEQIMDLTDGVGVDVAIDCAGQRVSVANSFLAVRIGGTVVFNGESNEEMLAPSRDFNRRELWAVGCWYYFFHEIDEMIALWRKGLDVRPPDHPPSSPWTMRLRRSSYSTRDRPARCSCAPEPRPPCSARLIAACTAFRYTPSVAKFSF